MAGQEIEAESSFFSTRKKYRRHMVMGLGFILALGMIDFMGFFFGIDHYAYDLFFRLRGIQAPPEQVIIVAVDEKSLARLGPWPIPRHHYADFLDRTVQAAGIFSDIILAEPAPGDPRLKAAMENHSCMVLPAYVDRSCTFVLPVQTLGNPTVGHVHTEPGIDGVVRQVFHTLIIDGRKMPSAASALSELLAGRPAATADFFRQPGSMVHEGNKNGRIRQEAGRWINYYGPPGTIPRISFSDVLENRYPSDYFSGKILLLGLTAAGIDQDHLTSFSQNRDRMPGVEIQATILGNLLDGSHIRILEKAWQLSAVTLIFLFCAVWFARLDSCRALAAGGFLGLLLISVIFIAFAFGRFWVAPSAFVAALTGALVLGHIIKVEAISHRLFQARQDWETSFAAITDAVIIQDRAGRPVLSNPSAARGALEVLERHGPFWGGSPSPVYDRNLDRYFEIQSFDRFGIKQKPAGSVHIVRDVTERVMLRHEQKALQTQLAQSQKMEAIGTLAGGIAHDFNNILTAIMGYTQLAGATISEEKKARKNLEEILKACAQAAGLVSQILNFSRRGPQEKVPMMVRPIAKQIVQLLKGTLPKSISIQVDAAGKEKIVGDAGQIYQVILNLCTNAYQAIGEGPGDIKVVVEPVDLDNSELAASMDLIPGLYVKISVADTGRGIPEVIRNRVFEPYFTTREKETGTGLGLATTHGIVRNHGGSIFFESWENQGTCFHVYLPMAESETVAVPGLVEEEQKQDVKGRLLLVDDRKALVDIGCRLLENMGYTVEACSCPEKALALFTAEPGRFNAVITDYDMKKMTGIALAERLLKVRADIAIVLCTGLYDTRTRKAAAAAGVSAVVKKPYSVRELSGVVQSVLADHGDKR